jgi:hypothetical protein
MAMILPKGIVVNTPEIEGNIERMATEPLDLADIAKFWKGRFCRYIFVMGCVASNLIF